MKRSVVIFAILLLLSFNLFTGCGPEKETAVLQEPVDYVIEWVDPTVEQLVRDFINKPEGDIQCSELDFVEKIKMEGGVYLFINDKDKDGTVEDMVNIYPSVGYDVETETYTNTIVLNGTEYEPQNIAVCDDFAHFRNLKELWLTDMEVGDLNGLAKLKNIKSFIISSTQVPDISPLAGLLNLTRLDVSNYGVDKINDIRSVSELKNLTSLSVFGADISDLSFVSGLPNLEILSLMYCNISDLSELAKLDKLEQLSLSGNNITDVTALKGLKNLNWLDLYNNPLTDISELSGLTCDISFDPESYSGLINDDGATEPIASPAPSTPQTQTPSAPAVSSAGSLKGIWVDEIGITNSGGMSTLPPGILFSGNELYIGNWYSGVTPEDIIADAGGQGYSGPTGTYELKSGKIIITWNGGSGTAEWKLSGDTFSTGQAKFVPDGSSYSGKVID